MTNMQVNGFQFVTNVNTVPSGEYNLLLLLYKAALAQRDLYESLLLESVAIQAPGTFARSRDFAHNGRRTQ